MVGSPPATSPVSSNQQSRTPDQLDTTQISIFKKNQTSGTLSQVDQYSVYGSALQRSDDEERGKGVSYCDLDTENSSSNRHDSDNGDIDTLDQSMPCITRTEGP